MEQAKVIEAEFRYYETLSLYNERTLDKAIDLIDRYEAIIKFQRRLIGRMGSSPCVERMWLLVR